MAYFDEANLLWLQTAKSPSDIAYAAMTALLQMANAVNYMDESNFPNKVSGDSVLGAESVTGSNILKNYSTPLKKLVFTEWPFVLFKTMPIASTTTSVDGGYFYWDPAKFPGGSWYLEALLKVTSDGTATLKLMNGAVEVANVSTTNTDWTLKRGSSPITLPASAVALTCTLTSSESSYTAYCAGASLIYIP